MSGANGGVLRERLGIVGSGTIVEGREDTAAEKVARLADAGITVAEEISEIPALIASRLRERSAA